VIGALLKYKLQAPAVMCYSTVQLLAYVAYLWCIYYDQRKLTILTWCIVHASLEIFQMLGKSSTWTGA
jgi:hypothetical protein